VLLDRIGGGGNGGLRLLKALVHRIVQISFFEAFGGRWLVRWRQ
jgi:hypothetical protein